MTKKTKINSLEKLKKNSLVAHDDLAILKNVVENFRVSISNSMADLINKSDEHDPIAKQFVPSVYENDIHDKEKRDPIGDDVHKKVNGIIHRYPDRCLFTPVHVCAVYCRFCFRKEKVGKTEESLSMAEAKLAFDYIKKHSEIWEVIITGGDPLILKPAILKKYIDELVSIEHVEVIRIHTRIPVVEPSRINNELIAALECKKPVYVLLHANHPKEFTEEAIQACALMVDNGIPMLSQTILLKNINDNIDILSQLMKCFIKNRIKPYYLHHADLARGTKHFRTSITEGQKLMKQLRGRFSGLCQPTYVLDIPDGFGKVPIGPNYIHLEDELSGQGVYQIEDYQGIVHSYDPDDL